MLTLCSLNYNSVEYLEFQEKIASKLAKYPYKRLIIDSSNDKGALQKLPNTEIIDGDYLNRYVGSTAHSHALNCLSKSVNSKYAVILDPDVVPIRINWDEIILNELKNGIDWLGVPYNPLHGRRRLQNVPTCFFLAFNVEKVKALNLDWSTFHQNIRKRIYWFYHKFWKILLRRDGYPKWFDFENGFKALLKVRRSNLNIKSFEMVQPWEEEAQLNFNISELPADKTNIDPLIDSYPEEWHFEKEPFVTHQRRSYAKSFNQTEYSKDWVQQIIEYLDVLYSVKIVA